LLYLLHLVLILRMCLFLRIELRENEYISLKDGERKNEVVCFEG